jgi:hypothetical protein
MVPYQITISPLMEENLRLLLATNHPEACPFLVTVAMF